MMIQPLTSTSLALQLQQTKQLQSRIGQFVEEYQRNCIAELQKSLHSPLNSVKHSSQPAPEPQFLPRVREPHKESIADSEVNVASQKLQMSRIFNEISIGASEVQQGPVRILKVGLEVEQKQYQIQLGRKEVYTLSNFNSFNNLKAPATPQSHFEFNELIQEIEKAYGRQLREAGCKKVLQQLQAGVHVTDEGKSSHNESKEQSTLLDSTISHTNLSAVQSHQFDSTLNPHPFSRNKGPATTTRQPVLKTTRTSRNASDKENRTPLLKKLPILPTKQLKIIRKNNTTSPMVMTYQDLKGVEIFCIDNKIMGKERDRLIRAVQCGKTIVNLE